MRNFLKFSVPFLLLILLLPMQIDATPQEFESTNKEQAADEILPDFGEVLQTQKQSVSAVKIQKQGNVPTIEFKANTGQGNGKFDAKIYNKALFFGASCGGIGRISHTPKNAFKAVVFEGTGSGGLEGRK